MSSYTPEKDEFGPITPFKIETLNAPTLRGIHATLKQLTENLIAGNRNDPRLSGLFQRMYAIQQHLQRLHQPLEISSKLNKKLG